MLFRCCLANEINITPNNSEKGNIFTHFDWSSESAWLLKGKIKIMVDISI
jgi:hypothetical protein